MNNRLRPLLPRLTLPLLLIALPACSLDLHAEPFTDREEQTYKVQGKPEVVLITFDGSIEVTSWDRSEVAVTLERRAATAEVAKGLRVRAEQNGNRVHVEVLRPEGFEVNVGVSPSVSFKVSVPRASDVEARSGDGAIRINDVSGRISLRSGDGSITGTTLSGDLAAHTGDGSIALDRVSGRVSVDTGDGSVSVVGVMQALRARTGDGSIDVRAAAESRVAEDWDITTGDGGMTVELPARFDADVDARTGDGHISVEGLQVTLAEGQTGRDELRGRLGAGGKTLRLRTGDGSIRLRRAS
jgi:nitrogen regulatory protein PII